MFYKLNKAFTLIELLTVIAIIGILAAIIIPAVGAARVAALKAKTKVQFNQWAVALQMFKTEYGYFPAIATNNKLDSVAFFGALTGKNYDGGIATKLSGNTKKLSFYSASDSEVSLAANGDAVGSDGKLKDAFGNTDIAVFYDTDGDGVVKSNPDGLTNAKVTSIGGVPCDPSKSNKTFDTTKGVRSGVILYSAGKGTTDSDIVYSWQ